MTLDIEQVMRPIAAIPEIRKQVFASEDFKEGIQSFMERRQARFQGR